MSNANLFSILLVEDDEVDVMNVRRAFQKSNITNPLLVAGNGLEALELLRAPRGPGAPHLPSLILLDLRMPKMSGIEFLRELRAEVRHRARSVGGSCVEHGHELLGHLDDRVERRLQAPRSR